MKRYLIIRLVRLQLQNCRFCTQHSTLKQIYGRENLIICNRTKDQSALARPGLRLGFLTISVEPWYSFITFFCR